jgi:hypothetical protein
MRYHEIIATSDRQLHRNAINARRRHPPQSNYLASVDEPTNRLYSDLMAALEDRLTTVESVPKQRGR